MTACAEALHFHTEISQYIMDPGSKCPKPEAMFVCERVDHIVSRLQHLAIENAQLREVSKRNLTSEAQIDAIKAALSSAQAFDRIAAELHTAKSPSSVSPIKAIVSELTTCIDKIKKLDSATGNPPIEEHSQLAAGKGDAKNAWVLAKPNRRRRNKTTSDEATEGGAPMTQGNHRAKIEKAKLPDRIISNETILKAKEQQRKLIIVDLPEGMESRDLLNKVKEHLNPRFTKIRLDGIRSTARGGVAMKVDQEASKSAVLMVLSDTQLKPRHMGKRSPRILVLRVPKDTKVNELREEIVANNALEEHKHYIRPLHTVRHGKIAPSSRGWLRSHQKSETRWLVGKKIYFDYQSCTVRDYVGITRCFKCQCYGHGAPSCPKKEPVCDRCALAHDTRDCNAETLKCANCIPLGRDPSHAPGSRECEAHIRAVIKVKNGGLWRYGLDCYPCAIPAKQTLRPYRNVR
ncbi:uncharacterized protein LOC112127634 [Cimex lectularius]|uniref:Gag-like protein n=1 Tax=Cimex lectularius TaxID=79782 RepID=A0A8I6SN37_CIMLE|nr:uncharacterized protein LOC112127634 [Cimex lectularius]